MTFKTKKKQPCTATHVKLSPYLLELVLQRLYWTQSIWQRFTCHVDSVPNVLFKLFEGNDIWSLCDSVCDWPKREATTSVWVTFCNVNLVNQAGSMHSTPLINTQNLYSVRRDVCLTAYAVFIACCWTRHQSQPVQSSECYIKLMALWLKPPHWNCF